ncbi:MAG: PilN domain-containing protein [Gammaproteobacteria bacterium]|nr:PilN domain-containing protein [Gammaproteobacteria bacterium]
MAHINLLPWREELRKQQRSEYLTILGITAAVAAAVWGGVHLQYNEMISYQNSRNDYLTTQIQGLDRKIAEIRELERQKERLIARMQAIESLQTSRPLIVRLFDELVMTLPDGVYLKEITQSGRQVTIRGIAQSNARVSSLMRNVEASQWVTKPKLNVIQATTEDGQRIADFTLVLEQASQQTDEADGGDAG